MSIVMYSDESLQTWIRLFVSVKHDPLSVCVTSAPMGSSVRAIAINSSVIVYLPRLGWLMSSINGCLRLLGLRYSTQSQKLALPQHTGHSVNMGIWGYRVG